jgi:simple sugar transport system ATP-binding protein
MAIVFISHKLHEVRQISSRVTVLRRGVVVGTRATAEVDDRELASLMVGRPTIGVRRLEAAHAGAVALRVEGLSRPGLHDVSLAVAGGEILGVAGVSGNGQSELVDVLCGMRRPAAGRVEVGGLDVTGASPSQVVAAGLGRIPEDRHAAVVGELSVAQNLALEHLREFRRGPQLDNAGMRRNADALIERFSIRAKPDDPAASLSGGNLQKLVLARVLSREPKAIVVAQPTRGLDVAATEFVHSELLAQRERGAAVLLVSEDLDELLALADRLVVMYEGRIVGRLSAAEADPERLGLLMAGLGEGLAA